MLLCPIKKYGKLQSLLHQSASTVPPSAFDVGRLLDDTIADATSLSAVVVCNLDAVADSEGGGWFAHGEKEKRGENMAKLGFIASWAYKENKKNNNL